ncbi:unnamed protein product [Caenorhabditis auriculariae]|uniref:EF-hand domain-containing protein n=1 Tax=Caenorhabditis auriculariae TaxID=2777116 RepID=A0A8S1H8K6_9PELO|nr:unnamed protein product [Caenorhabditis auriculariae]
MCSRRWAAIKFVDDRVSSTAPYIEPTPNRPNFSATRWPIDFSTVFIGSSEPFSTGFFYKNEEMDIDDGSDRWEVGVQPPPLKQLASRTHFSPRWIKYMYAKFKNECPTGRMREAEFRKLLASIIAAEKATDQYISRLFLAFSGDDRQSITFENLVECLAHLNPQTAEANARWTMRIITGGNEESFGFPAFLAFTESVFALNEGKTTDSEMNLESVQQRAATVFSELDSDHDGLVTSDDMIRFFKTCHQENLVFGDTSSEKSIPNL